MTEETVQEKKDVVPSQYRDKYKETNGTCGDFIAINLQKISKDGPDGLNTVKTDNKIEPERWAGFNPGMQRMNLANVLRGRFLKGETIVVLGKHYNAKDMVEADFNGTVTDSVPVLARVAKFLELQDNERTLASLQSLFFPKAKGPSAEDRAAAKVAKDKEKADAKAAKTAEAEKVKADKQTLKDAEKADKAQKAADAKALRDKDKADKAEAKAAEKAEKAAAAAAAAAAAEVAKA